MAFRSDFDSGEKTQKFRTPLLYFWKIDTAAFKDYSIVAIILSEEQWHIKTVNYGKTSYWKTFIVPHVFQLNNDSFCFASPNACCLHDSIQKI